MLRAPSGRVQAVGPLFVPVLVFGGLTVSLAPTLGLPLVPIIAGDLGVSMGEAQWVLTITLLAGAVASPVLGRLGDGRRRKVVAVGALAAVMLGCALAATASGLGQLLVGRALQGIGYGVVPLMMALVREHLAGRRMEGAVGVLSITVAVGAGLGFPITALIAQEFGYHGAYWAGALFAGVALAGVLAVVPASDLSAPRIHLDVPGALLLGGGLGAALLGVSRADVWAWGSPQVLGLIVGGLAALVAWAVLELRVAHPLVDLRLAALPAVMAVNVAAVFMGIGMFGSISLVNRIAQMPAVDGFGFGASLGTTGLLLLPVAVGAATAKWAAGRLEPQIGLSGVMALGAAIVAGALALLAAWHDHLWQLAVVAGVVGVGNGATFSAMPAVILRHVPAVRTGSAMALNQILRVAGGAIGSAASIAILHAFELPGSADPTETGFAAALGAAALSCLVACVAALSVRDRASVITSVDRRSCDR